MKKLILAALICAATSITACTYFQKKTAELNEPRSTAAETVVIDGSGYAYDPKDTSCDGYPRLKVQTMPGTCLGMVLGHRDSMGANKKPVYKMPRTIIKVPGSEDFLIADMGGWAPKAGALFWVRNEGGKKHSLHKVWEKLDHLHALTYNERDQFYYIGEKDRIWRFHFSNGEVKDKQLVIDNLPDVAKHMHPLTQFVFNPVTNDLYLNSGAPNDACFQGENGNYKQRCPDETIQKMATIQRISGQKLANIPAGGLKFGDVEVIAQGLRNSMAMVVSPKGRFLIQGENSRDFPELEEPYEEMNVIQLDKDKVQHYGWPYCYNNHGTSPEWDAILIDDKKELLNETELKKQHGPNPFYCGRKAIAGLKDYQRPFSLIPPHAAPLAMDYYHGEMFKDMFEGQLLMSWHGHRTTGQRFVMYKVNSKEKAEGLPLLKKAGAETYAFNMPDGCFKRAAFVPRGGFRQHIAPYTEIISGWGPVAKTRPKGAPLGFTVANDGSIWIVEDKNQTVVRLARTTTANFTQACNNTPGQNKDTNVPLLVWRNVLTGQDSASKQLFGQYQVIKTGLLKQKYCMGCHENFTNKDLKDVQDEFSSMDFFVRSGWLKSTKPGSKGTPEESLLFSAITSGGLAPPMPPTAPGKMMLTEDAEGKALLELIRQWINKLPNDTESRYSQITLPAKQNIRSQPGTASTVCGQFQPNDIAYIDPRAASKIKVADTSWSKVYLVPGHSRLAPNACPHPADGVFYIAK